jgi:phospholipid/cholesterol/gamma-HCH transport system permease protein
VLCNLDLNSESLTFVNEPVRKDGLVVPSNISIGERSLDSGLLEVAEAGDGVRLDASGPWIATRAGELDEISSKLIGERILERASAIDVAHVSSLDTFGAEILDRLARAVPPERRSGIIRGLDPRFNDLFHRIQDASAKEKPAQPHRSRIMAFLEMTGRTVFRSAQGFASSLVMLGDLTTASLRVIRHPSRFRLTSAIHQLDRVGWQAVPIIVLITFLIGCIIAQQGFFHFRKFGADDYVVDMIGILTLREIGVLIVAIMVAGRSGSAYTAEIGSMKMREEIDALRTMGLSPTEILVLPRVLALIIALPALDFIGSMSALYGGGLTAWFYGHMAPEIFIARLRDAISITHFEVGMIKAPFMALAIGVVACAEGLAVKGSAESLGTQTTSAVVKSIFLVIVLDGLFAVFFAAIGM